MQVLELRRPLDKKGEKREKIKRRRRRFLNVVCNRLKTFFEVVLNFTNYVIGISSGHLVQLNEYNPMSSFGLIEENIELSHTHLAVGS